MKAVVDKDLCIGCGMCPSACPEVFTMEDDGKAGTLVSEVPGTSEDSAEDARDGCPVSAISIEE
ncbi:ferredoxin [Clostridium sp. LBM24168]